MSFPAILRGRYHRKSMITSWKLKIWASRKTKHQKANKKIKSKVEPHPISPTLTPTALLFTTPISPTTTMRLKCQPPLSSKGKKIHKTLASKAEFRNQQKDSFNMWLKLISEDDTKELKATTCAMEKECSTTTKEENISDNGKRTKWMEKECFTILITK